MQAAQGILGILAILGFAWMVSEDRRAFPWRTVIAGMLLQVLIAAVLQVTRQQRKTVAWIVGHGEGDPTSNDRQRGFATARAFLENEYYEVVPISLLAHCTDTRIVSSVMRARSFLADTRP